VANGSYFIGQPREPAV